MCTLGVPGSIIRPKIFTEELSDRGRRATRRGFVTTSEIRLQERHRP